MATVTRRSPGRVNLIGEHTDYNDGFVLPLAIQFGCTATAATLAEPVVRVGSAQQPGPVEVPLDALRPGVLSGDDAWAAYALGVVHELRRRGHPVGGVHLELDSDVPVGAGLSSSAALVCSVAAAVDGLAGLDLTREELVATARAAENDFVGAPTGGMDQLVSVFGEAGHALLCDMRSLAVEPIPFDPAAAGLRLLVVDTRAEHRLTDGPYAQRREQCAEAARRLGVPALRDVTDIGAALDRLADPVVRRRARHVLTENARTVDCAALLRAGRIADIGALLDASHASMRDDFEITVPEVDVAAAVLRDVGALGARMTGGGFGGCVIALIAQDRVDAGVAAVERAYATRGFTAPAHFVAEPSAGTSAG